MPAGPLSGPLEFLIVAPSRRAEALSHWHPQCPLRGPMGHSVAVRGFGGWLPNPGWRERPGHPLPLCGHQVPCVNATFVFVLLSGPSLGMVLGGSSGSGVGSLALLLLPTAEPRAGHCPLLSGGRGLCYVTPRPSGPGIHGHSPRPPLEAPGGLESVVKLRDGRATIERDWTYPM